VVAATSGNTGASVAMISAMKGYHYIGMLHGSLQCASWCSAVTAVFTTSAAFL